MKFKDTEYGDLTGKVYNDSISVPKNVTSLEGCPKEVIGSYFSCTDNPNLKSLEFAPKIISGQFACYDIGVDDILGEIIKYQIKAKNYYIRNNGKWMHPDFEEIQDKFDAEGINKRVKRKSMRTLLGLDK